MSIDVNLDGGSIVEPNPFKPSTRPPAQGQSNHSWWPSVLSFVSGLLSVFFGWVTLWSAEHLGNDDFHVFLTMFVVASLFAWPIAFVGFAFGVYAVLKRENLFLSLTSICLCLLGLWLIVSVWSE